MFFRKKSLDQESGSIERNLLSVTSHIPERHGELAATVSELPIVTCRKLGRLSSRTMRHYFYENKTPIPVRNQVKSVASGLSAATNATLKYLKNEDLPKPDLDAYFPDLDLRLCEEEGSLVDESIRQIIGRIGVGGYFDHGKDNRTYLFRIATGDPAINMVTELHRFRMPETRTNAVNGHVDVRYTMSISGFDVPQ